MELFRMPITMEVLGRTQKFNPWLMAWVTRGGSLHYFFPREGLALEACCCGCMDNMVERTRPARLHLLRAGLN